MSTNASNVRVGISGAVMRGPLGATAPTGTADEAADFTDLGWISEDGVEIELPGEGDTTAIKGWQNGGTVRKIRTPSDDNPTWHFTMLETTKDVIETYFGVTITQTATEGKFTYKVQNREPSAYIVDVIDGAELARDYIPNGIVTDVGAITYSNGDPIGYEVTVEGDLDQEIDGNFVHWATALKSS